MRLKLFFISLTIGIFGCEKPSSKEERPNILFCIMDDAGIQMSAYGYDWCKNPTFDKLSKNGLLFYFMNIKNRSVPL